MHYNKLWMHTVYKRLELKWNYVNGLRMSCSGIVYHAFMRQYQACHDHIFIKWCNRIYTFPYCGIKRMLTSCAFCMYLSIWNE